MDYRFSIDSPELNLLRNLACLTLDEEAQCKLQSLCTHITDWTKFVAIAESHGIAALAANHLRAASINIPEPAHQQLLALSVRHRRANAVRLLAMQEVMTSFNGAGIKSVILKGFALLHTIYPAMTMRAMGDIDILVPSEQQLKAQSCLLNLGYSASQNSMATLHHHHHLPVASKLIDGVNVCIEVHRDALSGDVSESIAFGNFTSDPIPFQFGQQTAYHLGHVDMLRHLCHHTMEPAASIKLSAIVDLYGYASAFLDQVDLKLLAKKFSFVPNYFALLHYVTPLPTTLHQWVSPPKALPPANVGTGFTPLGQRDKGKLLSAFQASEWWLHGFYNVKPGSSLIITQMLIHPAMVTKWLLRRLWASYRYRAD